MNTIATFRLCTLTDDELVKTIDALTDKMFTEGNVPSRYIPARPNEDYDLLLGELLFRFKAHDEKIRRAIELARYKNPTFDIPLYTPEEIMQKLSEPEK